MVLSCIVPWVATLLPPLVKQPWSSNVPLFSLTGYRIKCIQCESSMSWDDCIPKKDDNKDEEEHHKCSRGFDSCNKLYLNGTVGDKSFTKFYKGCTYQAMCDNIACTEKAPDRATVVNCEVNCCQGNMCNGAKVPMVSALMLLACALVAFFRLVQIPKM